MSGGHKASTTALSWLSNLKATQLHRIAVATGVQSSGTKAVLAQRLSDELRLNNDGSEESKKPKRKVVKPNGDANGDSKPMSILSIDMGIRNLAYAHIIVPPKTGPISDGAPSPILNAWTRLAVSSFPTSAGAGTSYLDPPTPTSRKAKDILADDQVDALSSGQDVEVKESFSPDLYSSHAYSLITSLLSTYKPTHILIERQRFRSGGSSAVLEWAIRVGVFEGMLYAVLNTLRREGRIKELMGSKSDVDVEVLGIEPRRVAMYWTEGDMEPAPAKGSEGEEEGKGGRAKTATKTSKSKEGKKAKINLVANWWLSLLERKDSHGGDSGPLKISLAEGSRVKDVVDAYLRKWKGERSSMGGKKAGSGAGKGAEDGNGENSVAKIKKLDDLADCLLQGIAWLEWRGMREKIARDGLEAVASMDDTGSKVAKDPAKSAKAKTKTKGSTERKGNPKRSIEK
ncbi:hypothetical protein FQN54_009574 [Arachnomyces sp. PD_36]|nr:hypothetical protein FQN54_009574 [Arachnomyces sp. PD_36]